MADRKYVLTDMGDDVIEMELFDTDTSDPTEYAVVLTINSDQCVGLTRADANVMAELLTGKPTSNWKKDV